MTDRPNPVRARRSLVEAHRCDLRVAVPDAASGFMLVRRLPGSELTGSDVDGWTVASTANGDLPAVLSTIQQWLIDEGIGTTDVDVGGHAHTMTRG